MKKNEEKSKRRNIRNDPNMRQLTRVKWNWMNKNSHIMNEYFPHKNSAVIKALSLSLSPYSLYIYFLSVG
jgi:hypothetical protein